MHHFHFQSITSTNDYAKELLKQHNEVAVTAEHQTNGRGRNHRTWEGDFGKNIYLTYGRNHSEEQSYNELVSYQAIGCIAVIHSIRKLTSQNIFKLKYLNDVYALNNDGNQRKLSGILIEHSFMGNYCKSSVIGIGINIEQTNFSDEIKDIATSMKLLNIDVNLIDLVNDIIDEIKKLSDMKSNEIISIWKKELDIISKTVKIIGDNDDWHIKEMTEDGKLIAENVFTKQLREIDDGDSIRYRVF